MSHPSTDGTDPADVPNRRLSPSRGGRKIALGGVFVVLGGVVGLVSDIQQLFQQFAGQGAAPLLWGVGAITALTAIFLWFIPWPGNVKPRLAQVISALAVIALLLFGLAGMIFSGRIPTAGGGPSPSPTPNSTTRPTSPVFDVIGECTEVGGELSASSGGFTPGHRYDVTVTGPDRTALPPSVPTHSGGRERQGRLELGLCGQSPRWIYD